MVVGVGGQGTLLASKLLGRLFLRNGFDVKVSEVHGMSQRGGSVVTYVRYSSDKVYSPIIDKGQADCILSFELLEAARYAEYLKPGGILLTNNNRTNPLPVLTGAAQYPQDLLEKLSALDIRLIQVDALSLALKAGSSKAVNVALLGRLSVEMNYVEGEWLEALKESISEKFYAINEKAFILGRNS